MRTLAYRRQQHQSLWMHEHAGPKQGEVLGETAGRAEGAAPQWQEACTAPAPLLQAVVLTEGAEDTDGGLDSLGGQGGVEADGERLG